MKVDDFTKMHNQPNREILKIFHSSKTTNTISSGMPNGPGGSSIAFNKPKGQSKDDFLAEQDVNMREMFTIESDKPIDINIECDCGCKFQFLDLTVTDLKNDINCYTCNKPIIEWREFDE